MRGARAILCLALLAGATVAPGPADDTAGGGSSLTASVVAREPAGEGPILPGPFFLENVGQLSNDDVRFYVAAGGLTVGLAERAILIRTVLPSSDPADADFAVGPGQQVSGVPSVERGALVRITFAGANPVVPVARDPLPHWTHFLIGNDPADWRAGVRSFREVVYAELYDGIDLVYRAAEAGAKYEFVVRAGADPRMIKMTYQGIEGLAIAPGGGLVASTPAGEVRDAPVLAREDSGAPVECAFELRGSRSVGFACTGRDPLQGLVIDPLVYATFLGGSSQDIGRSIAVDSAGVAYVTGSTYSPDFPVTPGAFDETYNLSLDAFVAAFTPAGGALRFATFLGGWGDDLGSGLSVDSSGNVYVTGTTQSTDFPVTPGAFDGVLGGTTDAFVAKLDPTGSALEYATFLGGSDLEFAYALATDDAGSAFVTGDTHSLNFPATVGAYDQSHNGFGDGFVAKLSPTGGALEYATFLGGASTDWVSSVAIAGAGEAVVTGSTNSTDFPATPGGFDRTLAGSFDVFVAKFGASGGGLVYATYLGGQSWEYGYGVAADATGRAYVTGQTNSTDFPVTPDAISQSSNGQVDAFVSKLSPFGSQLAYSTYLGGGSDDLASSLALDSWGNVCVTGATRSAGFPTTPGAMDRTYNGGPYDGFAAKLNASSLALDHSTFLGGSAWDTPWSIALGAGDVAHLTGATNSPDFPVRPGGFDPSPNGGLDAFVAKLTLVETVNTPPLLEWTGEPNYLTDGLHPESGTTMTMFEYRVTYSDADGDPPELVEVRIDKPLGTIVGFYWLVQDMWLGAPYDYVAGSVYSFSTRLQPGTDYTYLFRARDGRDFAVGEPTAPIDAPDIPFTDAPPNAVAAATPTVAVMGQDVAFDGRDSTDDIGIVDYAWEFGDGATARGAVASHAYGLRGTFVATLVVWDTSGRSDSDTVAVDVVNRAPVADAGQDRSAFKKTLVALDGRNSWDPDGDPLGYAWNQESGYPVTLDGADTTVATFTPPVGGTYGFRLTVSDGLGGVSSASVVITAINLQPVADAGPDWGVPKNTPVTLDGRGSRDDDGDPLRYWWAQTAGPTVSLSGADTAVASFTPASVGLYGFALVVEDDDGGSAADGVWVTVWSRAPVAVLTVDPATARVDASIGFDAAGSSDPDGAVVEYRFEFGDGGVTVGPSPTIGHAYANPGLYVVRLTVTDDDGNTSWTSATVTITSNLPPSPAITVTPGTVGTLATTFRFDGTDSEDPDGTIASWTWRFGDGAEAVGPTADHRYSGRRSFTVSLEVTDAEGASARQEVVVRVVNRAPVILSSEPATPFALLAGAMERFEITASDPDGDVLAYRWRVDDIGTGPDSPEFVFGEEDPAAYALRVTVSDGYSQDWHEWTVTVHAPEEEPPPVANWKPAVAAAFALTLAAVGAWRATRGSPQRSGDPPPLAWFVRRSLPFVAAEAATGVASFLTGVLSIPPLVGPGIAVDAGILLAGLVVAAYGTRLWPRALG